MKDIYLSVVIPSYNETENLKRGVLNEVRDYLSKQKYTWEVIVSDDGSISEAKKLAKDFCEKNAGFNFLENEHAGKAHALWSGIQQASGEIVVFLDMDMSTPLKEIEKLLPFYNKGFDVVIGSRGSDRKKSSAFRLLASTIFRTVRRAILLGNIVDTQCGFKSSRTVVAKEIMPRLQAIRATDKVVGWKVTSYDVEYIYIAWKKGYKISEVTVEWEQRDLAQNTKKSTNKSQFVKESMDMLKELWRIKTNDLRGYYKK